MNLKRKDKIKLIPKGYYCCHSHRGEKCIFASIKGKHELYNGEKVGKEYCKFLHRHLQIQDQVKDCNVGRDYVDYYNENITYEPSIEPIYITKESAESIIEILNKDVKLPPYDGIDIKTLPREEIKKFFGK